MPSLGPRLGQRLAFWLWLSSLASLPPAGGWGVGWWALCSWRAFLWCSLNPLFCECARLRVKAFRRKVLSRSLSLSFFFVSLVIPQFGLLSQFSSLRLSSGHSGPVLSLRTDDAACASVPSPARWCWTRASGLLLCRQLWLGVYSVFFFPPLLVMLPTEIPELPTVLPVRGFPTAWKLLLHNSLPRVGLHS